MTIMLTSPTEILEQVRDISILIRQLNDAKLLASSRHGFITTPSLRIKKAKFTIGEFRLTGY
jgi:hypothetical protein